MDYVFLSTNNETILVSSNNESNHENLDSNHHEEDHVPNLFGQFPSPFLDDILQNHQLNSDRWKISSPAVEPHEQSPSKTKRVRKKRSAGKKDRHSKINTAQGLRDRRMRLSLHIARKFFGLQDMLGFDKASKTIEWLFSKSKKAIDEVTEGLNKSQNTTQSLSKENTAERCDQSPANLSDCEEVDSGIELDAASNKGKDQLKLQLVHDELIKDSGNSKKPTESDLLARESRDKARARARERTRERLMINNLEKSKLQAFGANPNELGFSSNHYIEESSSSPLEYSGLYAQAHELNTEDHLGTAAASSSTCYFSGYGYNKNFVNPPAGWLNSNNTFLGFLGGWDTQNFTENYGLVQNLAPSTGDVHGQNFSSVLIPPSNLVHFQTQNQRD